MINISPKIKLIPAAVATLMLFGSLLSYGETSIYRTDFLPVPASDGPLPVFGWNGYQNSTAEPIWETGEKPSAGAWHSLAGQGYTFSLGLESLLLYTEAEPFGSADPEYTFSQIDRISMNMRNETVDANLKVAIRLGTDWYASTADLNNSAVNTNEIGIIDFSTTQWVDLVVNPGSELSLGTTNVSISGSDYVTAVGVFVEDASSRVRLFSYDVTAIPEPSTASLILGVAVGLCVVVRRKL